MIKLLAPLFISAVMFAGCNNSPVVEGKPEKADSLATTLPVKLVVDDPYDPPYIFRATAYENETKLFTLTLPDGLPTNATDTFIEAHVNRKDDIKETIELSATPGNCKLANYSADTTLSEPTKWTTATINNIVFNKGTVGVLSSFPIYTYTWQQNNYCFCLVVKFETGIAFENEPAPPVFKPKQEEAAMLAMLKTIVLNPK